MLGCVSWLKFPSKMRPPCERPKQCEVCLRTISRGVDYARHLKSHAINKAELMYRCAVRGCNYRNLQKCDVGDHYLSRHAKIRACCNFEVMDENGNWTRCTYTASAASTISRHRKARHGDMAIKNGQCREVPSVHRTKHLYSEYVLSPLTRHVELLCTVDENSSPSSTTDNEETQVLSPQTACSSDCGKGLERDHLHASDSDSHDTSPGAEVGHATRSLSQQSEDSVQCEVCSRTFLRRTHYIRHLKGHAVNKADLMCRCAVPGCDYRSLQKVNVGEHYLSKHANVRAACKYEVKDENGNWTGCPYTQSHARNIRRHHQKQHGDLAVRTGQCRKASTVFPPSLLYSEYVLSPLTRHIELPCTAGEDSSSLGFGANKETRLLSPETAQGRCTEWGAETEKGHALASHHAPSEAEHAAPSLSLATRTLSTCTHANFSTSSNGDVQVAPAKAVSTPPTLVPLEELEQIHLKRFGYAAGRSYQHHASVAYRHISTLPDLTGPNVPMVLERDR